MFCDEMDIPMNSQLQHDLLLQKILGMVEEVADSSYCYSFDEEGEWIFAKFLIYHLNKFEFFLSLSEDDGCSIEDYWESSLSEDDLDYVREQADILFETLINDISDSDEMTETLRFEYEEKKMLFIDRVTYFPLMAFEITEDVIPEFLFWDRDFLLVEEKGLEKFPIERVKLSKKGNILGLSQVSENTQFYTGSERFELN